MNPVHDRLERELGEDWVYSHLADLPILAVYKVARFWSPDVSSGNRKFILMQMAGYIPMGVLMLLGLFVSLRPIQKIIAPAWLAVHGVLAASLFSSVVFYGSARFRDSITPVLMIYAALGLDRVVALCRGGRALSGRSSLRNPG